MKKKTTPLAAKTPLPSDLAQPAIRALTAAGFIHLEQLTTTTESDLQKLHGIGPNALKKLRDALGSLGISYSEKSSAAGDIDAYIAQFPFEIRSVLEDVRNAIRRAAPDAIEVISYKMPAFKQHGMVVYFAAWKQHIGLYPPIKGDTSLEKAVARYAGPKGNLQFPLNEPMPIKLIERIVKHRLRQNVEKAEGKRKTKQ